MHWWKSKAETEFKRNGVAYYRHSAQDRQENSIPIQREQILKFAEENKINIIKEFQDQGKSGLSTEGRDGFNEMLNSYVIGSKEEFEFILVLDVSRWGRFQDIDLSAYYTGLCQNYGKQIIYTSIGFPKQNDLLHFLHLNIERYRAASYSRELSDKVFKGCVKVTQQGFRAGAPPPYGLHRMLLDEQRNPVQILKPGQRKSIQNQRVTLAPGDEKEAAVVRRIFDDFVEKGFTPSKIADSLNRNEILSPGRSIWTNGAIRGILENEFYIGTMVYNKTQQKLQAPTKLNPQEQWVRQENAFEGIIDKKVFSKAQEIIRAQKAEHEKKYSNEDMLAKLAGLHEQYGKFGPKQIAAHGEMVSASTYGKRFMSLDLAYQNLHKDVLKRTQETVMEQMKTLAKQMRRHEDYIVLNDCLSVIIQPSVPIYCGYEAYWAFRPDSRLEVDITLGVFLSNSNRYDILGYLAFPRLLVESHSMKLFNSSGGKIELYGYSNLDLIKALLD